MNDEIQAKIDQLESERQRLDDAIFQEKKRLIESEEFQAKRKAEQKAMTEEKLKEKYPQLLKLSWTDIPKFLNEAYDTIKEISVKYIDIQKKEADLIGEVEALKREYVRLGGRQLCHEIRKAAGEPVQVCADYRQLLDAISVNSGASGSSGLWTQRKGVVLNFLDQARRNPRKDI